MTSEEYLAKWNLSVYDFLKMIYDFGHFLSPEALSVGEVREEELPSLDLDHPIVLAAVRSYQEWFKPQLDELAGRIKTFGGLGRPAIADGEVGPATAELMTFPRCGVSDYLPAIIGEANWPEACRHEITTSYKMILPGLTPERLRALWLESDANWSRELELMFRYEDGSYPNTRIYAFAANLGGNVLADQYLAQGSCTVRLQGRFDSNRTWSETLFTATCTHEHGHALGLGHLQDPLATMYPSVTQASMSRRGAPNGSDLREMIALGYKRRTSPPVPPEPIPPVPPGGEAVLTLPTALPPGSYRVVPVGG